MAVYDHQYAIYPGSVTLYDGTVRVFTAAELAEAYGLDGSLETFDWTGTAHASSSTLTDTEDSANNLINMAPNPSMETNITGYNAYNGATLTNDTTEAYSGSRSLKIVTTGAGSALQGASYPNIPCTSGQEYTISFYAKGPAGTQVRCYSSSGGDTFTLYTLTGAWQRLSHTFTAGNTNYWIYIMVTGANESVKTVHIDAVMGTLGATLQDYFDGSFDDTVGYVTIDNNLEIPQDENYFDYIHLKPRADNIYPDYRAYIMDDGEVSSLGPDFDGDKQYIEETDPMNIDRDSDLIDT
jgi:hypothetical protein